MDKWIKLLVSLTTIFIVLELIIVNINSGAGSGAALISDSVATFILISFFSSGSADFMPSHDRLEMLTHDRK